MFGFRLIQTGGMDDLGEPSARIVGSDGHITKPFEAQALVNQVTELLERGPVAPPTLPSVPGDTAPDATVVVAAEAPSSGAIRPIAAATSPSPAPAASSASARLGDFAEDPEGAAIGQRD